MYNLLEDYIQITYGYQIEDEKIINNITRVIGYLKDNGFTTEETMRYLINNGPEINETLFTELTQLNVTYYNSELVIESAAPMWHPEKGNTDEEYYREPKCKFSINDLLNMFYNKLRVPLELRDEKRDIGALNHILNKYKFNKYSTLDFVITLIKLAEEDELKTCNVFDIEQYANEAYELFSYLVNSNKTKMIWRIK